MILLTGHDSTEAAKYSINVRLQTDEWLLRLVCDTESSIKS